MNAFDKENLTRPTFAIEQGGITAIIPRERYMAISRGGKHDTNRYKPDTNPIQIKADQKAMILEILKNNPGISMESLSHILGISKSSVQRRLTGLVRAGALRHIGPLNGGSWQILE